MNVSFQISIGGTLNNFIQSLKGHLIRGSRCITHGFGDIRVGKVAHGTIHIQKSV